MAPVAAAAPVVAALASTAAAGYGVYSDIQQGKEAEKMAERNAELIEAETAEEARRLKVQQEMNRGDIAARAYASGTRPGTGSGQKYLDFVTTEQGREYDWLKRAGSSRAAIERMSGRAGMLSGYGAAAGSLGRTAAGVAKTATAGQEAGWWGTTK